MISLFVTSNERLLLDLYVSPLAFVDCADGYVSQGSKATMISSPLDNVAKIDDLFSGYTFCALHSLIHFDTMLTISRCSRESGSGGEGNDSTFNRRARWTSDAEAPASYYDSSRRLLRSEVDQYVLLLSLRLFADSFCRYDASQGC